MTDGLGNECTSKYPSIRIAPGIRACAQCGAFKPRRRKKKGG